MARFGLMIFGVFLFCLYLNGDCLMGQELKHLKLVVRDTELSISKHDQSIKLCLKLFNRSREKIRLYCFYNNWSEVCPVDWLPEYVHPGLNMGVFNKKGEMQYQQIIIVDTEEDIMLGDPELFLTDSVQTMLNKRYNEFKNSKDLERKRIIGSEYFLSPGDSVDAELEIDLHDFHLKKGKYEIVIFYVMNSKIFEYIRPSKELFLGYVVSNKIELTVK